MLNAAMSYFVTCNSKEKIFFNIDILYDPKVTDTSLFLNERFIYIRLDGYWRFQDRLRNEIDSSKVIYLDNRNSRDISSDRYWEPDPDFNTQAIALSWVNSLFDNKIDDKFKTLGISINREEAVIQYNNSQFGQLYFIKSINYVFQWEYMTLARAIYSNKTKHRYRPERPLIFENEERYPIFLDEESTLINYIERFIKKKYFIDLEQKERASKHKKTRSRSTNYDDSEEAVMRSFLNDTSENFGF
ncbi:hypothetical protein [Spirosoma radiotolerans]|uniref:Uncharacterized protein n=1 Tax=Spirosoma radiotolerans TaxID=1379870 RepID=A0A0E3V9W3_9BACT|nr:hypothetical protein [Spirosoma radiotolerans]AKD57526.1 hypothetical protein SD10_24135 [Spirosoma radiotolerans]